MGRVAFSLTLAAPVMRPAAVALVLLAGCSGVRPAPPDAEADRAALLDADRAFASETAARGLEGWMDAYAPDAARLVLGGTREASSVVQGTDAIRAFDADLFADPTARLVWAPTEAGTFADGRTGFTTGRAALVRVGAPDTLYVGAYVTMWQCAPDGRWRVILDTGAADPTWRRE